MRIIYLFILSFILFPLSADDHKVKPGGEVGEFHYIKAKNPLAIVAATDKFIASDCGQKWQAKSRGLVLMQLDGSGMSHFFYSGFDDYESMNEAIQLASSCAAGLEFVQAIGDASLGEYYFNRIGELSLQKGDWTKDSVFLKYDLFVDPMKRGDYAKAWSSLVESQDTPGSSGLVTHVTGNGRVSHFAFNGGPSIPELMSGSEETFSSKEFLEFAAEVDEYRTVVNVMMVTPVKAWVQE